MTGVSPNQIHRAAEVIIGVDTHKDQHVAVAIDGRGVRLGEKHVPVSICGYKEIEGWGPAALGQFASLELKAQAPTVLESHAF